MPCPPTVRGGSRCGYPSSLGSVMARPSGDIGGEGRSEAGDNDDGRDVRPGGCCCCSCCCRGGTTSASVSTPVSTSASSASASASAAAASSWAPKAVPSGGGGAPSAASAVASDGPEGATDAGGKCGTAGAGSKRAERLIDLNEANHSKLLFASLAKYAEARKEYCHGLIQKSRVVADEATGKDLHVEEQRIYMQPAASTAFEAGGADGAPAHGAPSPAPSGGSPLSRSKRASFEHGGADADADEDEAAAAAAALAGLVGGEEGAIPLADFLESLTRALDGAAMPTPRLVRIGTTAEHMLLRQQLLTLLASQRGSGGDARFGLVPLVLSMRKLNELTANDSAPVGKGQARSALVRIFESEHAGQADMLKQAMEMRCLVVLAEVEDEAELFELKETAVEELQATRLVLSCRRPEAVPLSLRERCEGWAVAHLGLYFNDVHLSEKETKEVFRRLRLGTTAARAGGSAASTAEGSHYGRVAHLHIGAVDGCASEMGRDAMKEINELLLNEGCSLRGLDVSFTLVDGFDLIHALRHNASLTSLDVRAVPRMHLSYETLADVLLQPSAASRLGYLRCDAFELLEAEPTLDLHERRLDPGATKLLAGLLKNNRELKELDLSATSLDRPGALALAAVLEEAQSAACPLTKLSLKHNPLLDDTTKNALRAAASKRGARFRLEV